MFEKIGNLYGKGCKNIYFFYFFKAENIFSLLLIPKVNEKYLLFSSNFAFLNENFKFTQCFW